jgi:hypothetical protein
MPVPAAFNVTVPHGRRPPGAIKPILDGAMEFINKLA